MRNITDKDIQALKQTKKVMYCKVEVLRQDFKVLEVFNGKILSGNYSINADSDIRRTCNLTISLQNNNFDFDEDILYNHYLRIYIGYTHLPTKEILYYNIGVYMFDKESYSYDVSTNELSFSLSDLTALMDAEHRGALYGAETSVIAAVNPETGQRYPHEDIILKNIVMNLLKDYGIKTYRVDDIGIRNRQDTDEYKWNELPYDLEFNIGSGFIDIMKQIRDLYSNYEFFFDVDGSFIFQEKPSIKDDMIALENDLVQSLVINENIDSNVYDVKNVIEVWGKTIDFEKDMRTVNNTKYENGTYFVTSDTYAEDGYADGMKLAFKPSSPNIYNGTTYIKLNNLGTKPVYDKLTGELLEKNRLTDDNTYVFEYSNEKQGFYYLGSFQVHTLAVMTNGGDDENYLDDYLAEKFEYFSEEYNTNDIKFVVDKNNKYCIEKVGEIRKSFHGDKYANLDNVSMALDYAEDKLNQLCRRVTSLSLEMILVPWLDVNQKITYKTSDSKEEKTYVTQSISGDILSGVMSVNLRDFYNTLDDE